MIFQAAIWHDNFTDAKAEAEELNLPILLVYTAPEWCGYCVKLDDRLFDTSKFKKFSNGNLVLLIADFSKKSDKENWLKENAGCADKFKAPGLPCTYVISSDLNKLGKLGGYESEWSMDVYIEKIAAMVKK